MRRRTFGTWQDRAAWLLVATGIVLMLLPTHAKYKLSLPIQTVLLAPLRGLTLACKHSRLLETENRRLAVVAADLAVENARLRSLLGRLADPPANHYKLVRSPVI
ncbi:MAG: hypothetical protein ABIL25_08765, partial [candidate division WOR-3 bacterium]